MLSNRSCGPRVDAIDQPVGLSLKVGVPSGGDLGANDLDNYLRPLCGYFGIAGSWQRSQRPSSAAATRWCAWIRSVLLPRPRVTVGSLPQ